MIGARYCYSVPPCVLQHNAKEPSAELEAVTKELAAAKERVQQMTNKMGQIEQKV